MLTPPEDLASEQVSAYLRQHWGMDSVEATYAPLGHGSHNWVLTAADGRRWFAKANRHGPDSDFFQATYQTMAALCEAGLDFVLGPIRDLKGRVKLRVAPNWELAVFPYIEGRNPDFNSGERVQVAEILGRLHTFEPIPEVALRWEPGWYQPELKQILADELGRPWTQGPYGERARALLRNERTGIEWLLGRSDEWVAQLAGSSDPWVMTHGEPHGGNTMLDTTGKMHLIDCDAMMVAPRERDLRLLLYASHKRPRNLDNAEVLATYQRTAGPVQPRGFVLELFRAEWHLIEIARYAELFSGEHDDTADVRSRWKALNSYVPVTQNWP